MPHARTTNTFRTLILTILHQLILVVPAFACTQGMGDYDSAGYEPTVAYPGYWYALALITIVFGGTSPIWAGALMIRPFCRRWRSPRAVIAGIDVLLSIVTTLALFALAALLALGSFDTALHHYLKLPSLLRHIVFASAAVTLYILLSNNFKAWLTKFKIGRYSPRSAIFSLFLSPWVIGLLAYLLLLNIGAWVA